jgi:hypothetical protein
MGRLILEPLRDGRLMRVVEPFGFLDPEQKRWPVPVGTKVDGASIPQPLWSLIGGPFEGKYRDASVVHDYYCDVRTEPCKAVHRVFYLAMRASGLSDQRAKFMYAAVYFAGLRWSVTAVENARLPKDDGPTILFSIQHSTFGKSVLDATSVDGQSAHEFLRSGKVMWPKGTRTTLSLAQLEKLIETESPGLEEIERSIDSAAEVLESPFTKSKRKRLLNTAGLAVVPQ